MKEIKQWFALKGYTFVNEIGSGSFGKIYSMVKSDEQTICAKVEPLRPFERSYLIHEAYVMKYIWDYLDKHQEDNQDQCILRFYSYELIEQVQDVLSDYRYLGTKSSKSIANQSVNLIFMQHGGQSLQSFKQKEKNISEFLWFDICKQVITNMQQIHSAGIIHRDMKPHNILIKTDGNINKIYIIDFGLAKIMRKTNQEVFLGNKNSGFVGTIMYSSIRAHQQHPQHYADDLECVIYIMMYMALGSLPWSNIGVRNSIEDKYTAILLAKQELFKINSQQSMKSNGAEMKKKKKIEDTRFSQFTLTINQQRFLRFFSDQLFKRGLGISYKKPDYSILIQEINNLQSNQSIKAPQQLPNVIKSNSNSAM